MPEETTSTESVESTESTVSTETSGFEESTETPSGIFEEGGMNFVPNWTDQLVGDEYDESRSTLANYKDFGSLAKSFVTNKRAATARTDGMVRVPTAESSPEEIAAYRTATGVPDTADGYEITPPEGLPEGMEFNQEQMAPFREFALEHGLSNDLASKLVQFQANDLMTEAARFQQEQKEVQEADEKALQQEWGGKWEQKSMNARRAAATFGLGADHPAMQSPDIRRAMAKVAESISEDSLVSGEKMSGTLSPGNEAKDIMNNPDNPMNAAFHDTNHPNHETAYNVYMQRMEEQTKREGYE